MRRASCFFHLILEELDRFVLLRESKFSTNIYVVVIGKRGIDLKKAFITLISMFVLLFGSLFFTTSTHAEPSNLDEVKAERQKLKSKLSDKELEIAEVLDEIEELHGEIVQIEDALQANQ